MTINFKCQCGQTLSVQNKFGGQTIKCRHCKQQVQVPNAQNNKTIFIAIGIFVLLSVVAFLALFWNELFPAKNTEPAPAPAPALNQPAPKSEPDEDVKEFPANIISEADSMVKKFGGINETNKKGETPLVTAVARGDALLAEYLITRGAKVDLKDELSGRTVLFDAVETGNLGITKVLVRKGAGIKLCDAWGDTPLHCAARQGKMEIVEFLVSKGAEIETKNKDGETALHCALSKAKKEVAVWLIEHGADVNARQNDGYQPLDLSVLAGFKDVSDMLRKRGAIRSDE